jgi:hypothetical protein
VHRQDIVVVAIYNEDRCSNACLQCVDLYMKIIYIYVCVCVCVCFASKAEKTHSQKGAAKIDECQ